MAGAATFRRALAETMSALVAPSVLVVAAVLANPVGEFPISDDFDYSATAFDLARYGEVRLSDWPSMTLLAHAAWGALFVKPLGPTYAALRVANLATAAIGATALYVWMRLAGGRRALSAFAAVAVFLNPQVFCYSCSFMTDVFGLTGLFVLLAAIAACDRASRRKWYAWAGAGLIGAVFYLGRQTALLPLLAAAPLLALQRRFVALVASIAPVVVVALVHRWWLSSFHGIPANYLAPILNVEGALDPLRLLSRVVRLTATISFYAAPVAFCWLNRSGRAMFGGRSFTFVSCIVALAAFAATLERVADVLPYDGRLVYDLGIGADFSFARGDELRGPAISVAGERWSLFAVAASVIAAGSFATIVAICASAPRRLRTTIVQDFASPQFRAWLTMLGSSAGAGLFALLSFSFYERYLIPVYCLVIPALAAAPIGLQRRRPSAAAWLMLILFGGFSVVGMQDYFSRNRVVWQAIALLRERGVADSEIDGGFEFAGVCRFNSRYRDKPERVRPFAAKLSESERSDWITPININPRSDTRMRLPYCVGFLPDPGARTLAVFEYRSWLRYGKVFATHRPNAAARP